MTDEVLPAPWCGNTSDDIYAEEFGQTVDPVVKLELERLHVGLPDFHETFFGEIPDLGVVSDAVFGLCTEGDDPLFAEGWSGWPAGVRESDMVSWLEGLIPKLEAFADGRVSTPPMARRKLLAQPGTPLTGPTGKRRMDIGFVSKDVEFINPGGMGDSKNRWKHILVAGELQANPEADTA